MIEDKTTPPGDTLGSAEIPAYGIPFGSAKIPRLVEDSRVTVVSYGLTFRMLQTVFDVQHYRIELIDLRSIYPVDYALIGESVKKTGALIIVEPDVTYGGVGAEIAANVTEMCYNDLRHPVKRFGAPRITIPASLGLHDKLLPDIHQITRALEELSE
jgi:pyruvate dehydrogenase E1 component beta subunit